MSWRRVLKSVQSVVAHGLLFTFTLLLVLKLDHLVSFSWWLMFFPLWLFHGVVARGRFSLPAPSVPRNRHWAPCHAVVAPPLLITFELLLCIYLESSHVQGVAAVNLKIVFIPLLAFEIIIMVDNFRMCRALMPGDGDGLTDDAIWEALPHLWVAISMVFFVAATVLALLKLCGSVHCLGWWHIFINFGIAECFAFIVCAKWSNPLIHRTSRAREATSSPATVRYADRSGGDLAEEEQFENRMCDLQEIGGHIMKVLLVVFQVLLCMHLEGTPAGARNLPVPLVFSPLLLLQGLGVLFSTSRLVDKFILLLRSEAGSRQYFIFSARIHDCWGFLHHGSRFLGWWSLDEGSRAEQTRLCHEEVCGYNTFSAYPPEIVKKMPKKDLAEEVWRLQAALGEQAEITKYSQHEYKRLRNEKVLCRVCFVGEISVVLLPCRHRALCSACSEKCRKCPVCNVLIKERLPVYDV